MKLFFAGAEVPGWRRLLHAQGASCIEMSYHGMIRRRLTPPNPVDLRPDGAQETVLLNSGGFSFNKNENDYSRERLLEIAADYAAYVSANIDQVDLFTEFDVQRLGTEWLTAQRRQVWDHVAPDKLMVVWHPEDGLGELQRLCDTYTNVAITQTALAAEQGGQDITPHLPRIVDSTGVRLHGMSMTKPDLIERIPFASVSSTSWLSPSHYGDTIIWTGNQLKRYPRKYKERARIRHRQVFIDAGFDADLIEQDDSTEVLKLSIWSWNSYAEHLNSGNGVTQPWNQGSDTNTETDAAGVDTRPGQTRNGELPHPAPHPAPRRQPPRRREQREMIPLARVQEFTDRVLEDDGTESEHVRTELRSVGESLRNCDTCFLAARGCPGFEPAAACVYEFPVQIRDARQDMAAKYTLLEMQLHRIMIAKMAEDMAGGYPDANLSAEMDRYMRMAKAIEQTSGFTLKVEARGDNAPAAGIMSRIFSPQMGDRMREIDPPQPADEVLQQIIPGHVQGQTTT